MSKRNWGILLLVLGGMSVLGSVVNGSLEGYVQEITLSNLVTIVLMIGMIVGGIVLIIKESRTKYTTCRKDGLSRNLCVNPTQSVFYYDSKILKKF